MNTSVPVMEGNKPLPLSYLYMQVITPPHSYAGDHGSYLRHHPQYQPSNIEALWLVCQGWLPGDKKVIP